MHSFPKHWIWSRNLFYPSIANSTSYLSYLNSNNPSVSSINLTDSSVKTESLNSNSPVQMTEINSDDSSIDNQDNNGESGGVKMSKKRNPYSIEELLKKPVVKKRKTVLDESHSEEKKIFKENDINENVEICE